MQTDHILITTDASKEHDILPMGLKHENNWNTVWMQMNQCVNENEWI